MERIFDVLLSRGFSAVLTGFSAIDNYLKQDELPFVFAKTGAGLSDLARLFDGLRFPGAALADGAAEEDGRVYLFRCIDPDERVNESEKPSFPLLSFGRDLQTGYYLDPLGVYPLVRKIRDRIRTVNQAAALPKENSPADWWTPNPAAGSRRSCMEAALILARYCREDDIGRRILDEITRRIQSLPRDIPPGPAEQRVLLTGLLASPSPGLGLELLKKAGFIKEFWPELALLDDVDHSKEFHPEGNVWKHTLETFKYRKKASDVLLSMGLLLHDAGKPLSESSRNHRFDGHAELGARQARRFLERLGFEEGFISDVCYLVKNHMLPAALPRLPFVRTGEIMASPLFPVLMELYRCDESSSFRGLDGYYESSSTYQSYLKYRRNPYRSADGKKTGVLL
jgi:poly(A) polymerase